MFRWLEGLVSFESALSVICLRCGLLRIELLLCSGVGIVLGIQMQYVFGVPPYIYLDVTLHIVWRLGRHRG